MKRLQNYSRSPSLYFNRQVNQTSLALSKQTSTVEPRFNVPLYNKFLGIRNDILQPYFQKCMEQKLNITNQFP